MPISPIRWNPYYGLPRSKAGLGFPCAISPKIGGPTRRIIQLNSVRFVVPSGSAKPQADHLHSPTPASKFVMEKALLTQPYPQPVDIYLASDEPFGPHPLNLQKSPLARPDPPTPPVVGLLPVREEPADCIFLAYDALDTEIAALSYNMALTGEAMEKVEVLNEVNQFIQKLVEITVNALLQIDSLTEIPRIQNIVIRFTSMAERIENILRRCEQTPHLRGNDLAIIKALVNSYESFLRDSTLIATLEDSPQDWITDAHLRQRISALPRTVFVAKEDRGYWIERGYKELAEHVLHFYENLFQPETLTRGWNGRLYFLKGATSIAGHIEIPSAISLFEYFLGWTITILSDRIVIDIGPSHAPII